MQSADVVIVVAGASDDHSLVHVIAGSTESPVIAVPIASSSLLLPPGVTCVAENHGLAAALFAARILRYSLSIFGAHSKAQCVCSPEEGFPCVRHMF